MPETIEKIPPSLVVTWWLRAWDWAVTSKSDADHTCGLKVGRTESGAYIVADMKYFQAIFPTVKRTMVETMREDGENVDIVVPTQGTQRGLADDIDEDPEFSKVIVHRVPETTAKYVRAARWILKAEHGEVFLLEGEWNAEFLRICESFTGHDDKEDDPIDAFSMAHTVFQENAPPGIYVAPDSPEAKKKLDTARPDDVDASNQIDRPAPRRRNRTRRRTFLL